MELRAQERVGGPYTVGEQGDEREGIGMDTEVAHAVEEAKRGGGGLRVMGICGDKEGKGDNIRVGHRIKQVAGMGEEAKRGICRDKVIGGKKKVGGGRELEKQGMEGTEEGQVMVAEGEADEGDEVGGRKRWGWGWGGGGGVRERESGSGSGRGESFGFEGAGALRLRRVRRGGGGGGEGGEGMNEGREDGGHSIIQSFNFSLSLSPRGDKKPRSKEEKSRAEQRREDRRKEKKRRGWLPLPLPLAQALSRTHQPRCSDIL